MDETADYNSTQSIPVIGCIAVGIRNLKISEVDQQF